MLSGELANSLPTRLDSMYRVSLTIERLFHDPDPIRRQDDAADTLSLVYRLTRSRIRWSPPAGGSSAGSDDWSYRSPCRGDVSCSAVWPVSYSVPITDSR